MFSMHLNIFSSAEVRSIFGPTNVRGSYAEIYLWVTDSQVSEKIVKQCNALDKLGRKLLMLLL